MTDKEIAAGLKKIPESLNQLLLGRPIKVNHRVSTKNNIKGPCHWPRVHQIQPRQPNQTLYVIFDLKAWAGAIV